VYAVEVGASAEKELRALRPFDQGPILRALERQLTTEPAVESRNRKQLVNLIPPFEATPPIWELRVGEFRVFYDVDDARKKVFVRAIRRKPPHKTTEEIL
jgi:mRNA-degrading endonuclease RelE of RelBE toxin-antitoxin system